MKFFIDDLPVLFPYPRIYPEQYAYMCDLKRTLDSGAGGHCVLEMPSGTGKTVSLLSLIVAYQQHYPEHRKLIYCSRTMSEIEKALAELKALMKFRADELGHVEEFRGLGLTSRKNLCLHPSVKREKSGAIVDARCRSLTAGFVREKKDKGENVETCIYHDNLDLLEPHNLVPNGVWTLDGLLRYGEQHKQCPYFTARRMMQYCNVIIYSYHYLLDPKIAERVSKEFSKDCIVVFDEAHNIDNVCIESLSTDITEDSLRKATRGAVNLERKITEMKETDREQLENEYQKLVEGLRDADEARQEDAFMANPALPDDLLKEAVPGNIRRAEHFTAFLKRFIEYLKTRMKVRQVISETPPSFLSHLKEHTFIEKKPLRFCAERLTSLVRTLELTNIEDYQPLQEVATFATLVATYEKGFLLILEPFESDTAEVPNPVLHFTCLDAAIAIKPVFDRFSSVIITSGTMSPLEMYPKMLGFSTVVQESYAMTLARRSFLPMIVTRGSDQAPVSTSFQVRNEPSVVRNYGNLLTEMARVTPDGMVVFFPSYLYMESIISMWQGMGILDEVWKYKLILVETPDAQETSLALETYRTAELGWGVAALLGLMLSRILNIWVIKQRSKWPRIPRPNPNTPGEDPDHHDQLTEYVVDLGNGRVVCLRGLASDLQAITTTKWLRDQTHIEGYLEAAAKLTVYLVAAFSGNLSQIGSIIFLGLLLTTAGLLGLSNAHAKAFTIYGRLAAPTTENLPRPASPPYPDSRQNSGTWPSQSDDLTSSRFSTIDEVTAGHRIEFAGQKL
ncbi:hypothetical protein NUW58_g2340 [Xylaria curta]|uniref:Uncharacterized protein n=1 Tax=Xylaria curta TaxID=42375 RepID=A0ACC1PG33_9PEZI|nr:hypothetical protein NUW58_g2340 [Xylaria curta]